MTNVVVLIKHVPDYTAEWTLSADDYTLDRAAVDGIIDEINERAVEAALQINDRPCIIDVRTPAGENVYPMIPAGKTFEDIMEWGM